MQRGSGLGKRLLIFGVAACAVLAIAVVAGATPTNNTLPVINGSPVVGQEISVDPGTWSTTEAGPVTQEERWQRCETSSGDCAGIGHIAASYTPVDADLGKWLRVRELATDGVAPDADAFSNIVGPVAAAPAAPSNTTPPGFSGTASSGQTLTITPGAWSGNPAPAIAQQWLRCDQAGQACVVVGSGGTYGLTAADVGFTMRALETASNGIGDPVSAASGPTPVVTGPPVIATQPTIDNPNPAVGQTITATPGTVSSGYPAPVPNFDWRRCNDGAGGGCSPDPIATTPSYTTVPADAGKFIRVRVTWTNGVAPAAVSAWVQTAQAVRQAPVATAPPVLTAASLNPLFVAGQATTLAVAQPPGAWTASPPIAAFLYQWQRCPTADPASCVAIGGANAPTYGLQQIDVGNFIRVQVTAQNGVAPDGVAFAATASAVRQAPSNTGTNGMVAPSIDAGGGPPARGQVISGSTGVWFAFPAPTTIAHQWQRCPATGGFNLCADIGEPVIVAPQTTPPFTHTGVSPYTVTDADLGSRLRLRVLVANGIGAPVQLFTADATAPVRGGPVNRTDLGNGAATLSDGNDGDPKRGETMTATSGLWTGFWAAGQAPLGLTHTWQRCPADGNPAGCVNIAAPLSTPIAPANAPTCAGPAAGAAPPAASPCSSASVLPLTDADLGSRVRVVVGASNGGGNAQVVTPMSTVVLGPPIIPLVNGQPNAGLLPTVAGAPQQGLTLVGSTGSWSAFPAENLSYGYEWLRCTGTAVDSCSAIGGAGSDIYQLTGADVGRTIRLRVTASNGVMPNGVAVSAATGVVAAPPSGGGGIGGPGSDMVLQLSQSSSGGQVKYTLTARNVGTVAAEGVTVRVTLAPQLSLVSATASVGSCAAGITCSLGTVGAGASQRVEITARAGQTGTFPFSATVSSSNPDVNPTNNTVTTSTRATVSSERGPTSSTKPIAGTAPRKATGIKKVAAKLHATRVGKTWVVTTKFSLVSGKAKLRLVVTPNGSTKPLSFLKGSRLGGSVAKSKRTFLNLNAPKPATFPVKVVMPAKGFARKQIYVIRIKATAPNGLFSQLDIGFNGIKVLSKKQAAAKKKQAASSSGGKQAAAAAPSR